MRIVDGNTIEIECDSCACTFTTSRGEDGEPDEILCSECKQAWTELRAELARERDRVWFETFLSFPFKQLPAPTDAFPSRCFCGAPCRDGEKCFNCGYIKGWFPPCEWCDSAEHHVSNCEDRKGWREHQDLLDAADQAAYYRPKWEENQ